MDNDLIRSEGNETHTNEKANRVIKKPSERTALFILSIIGWWKDIVGIKGTLPHGQAFQHNGKELESGKTLCFTTILLVEDNPTIAAEFLDIIRNYYVFGKVLILVAHTYKSAVTFFENEEVELVIMDADLDDEDGDGETLTRKFFGEKPGIIILANSSSRFSNLKLTSLGANDTLGKNPEKMKSWFLRHDPTGHTG